MSIINRRGARRPGRRPSVDDATQLRNFECFNDRPEPEPTALSGAGCAPCSEPMAVLVERVGHDVFQKFAR